MADLPLVGEDGHATGDAAPLITNPFDRNSEQLGAVRPLGAKGFGWLILVEVLSSLMAGGNLAVDIPFDQSAEDPWTGGFFLMAVDIGALVDVDHFKAKVDRLVRSCRSSERAEGFSEIVMPGERAQREAERRRREGIPLRDEDWGNVERIAGEVSVNLEALREGT